MKVERHSFRLIFSGDSVLVVLGTLMLVGSIREATGWPPIDAVRAFGGMALFLAPAFFLLCCLELAKYRRLKRTFFSAALFFAASVITITTLLHRT